MRYSDFIEKEPRGKADFPLSVYRVGASHPRYVMEVHWHPELEIIRVRHGTFTLFLNKACYQMQTGDVAVVNPGTLHHGLPSDCLYDCAVFAPEMLRHMLPGAANRLIKELAEQSCVIREYLPHNACAALSRAVDALFEALDQATQPGGELEAYAALYHFLALLQKEGAILKNPLNSVRQKQLSHLTSLLEWINDNHTQKITLATLAKLSGMNEKYLCRFFKAYTSLTPIEYINRVRVEKAAADLRDRHMTVTEVAYANGFNDSAYFCKVFRRVMGCTPREYQQQAKKHR